MCCLSFRRIEPQGLPYELFSVPDVNLAALLAFFELVRHWAIIPTIWRSARVSPLHKTGAADDFNNYRPMSLLRCSLKIIERLLLARLLPSVDPQLDESQAGFRLGAKEHGYTLAETLRLRGGRRTFCAIIDVRKAFDIAWRDAVLLRLKWGLPVVRGLSLLTGTSARAVVNGSASSPWTETACVRQGSVLGPLLFNILFNGLAAAARAACPGVGVGSDGHAPRVTLQMYADDVVVLADSAVDLKRALDAGGAWGTQWRFTFSIGPEKKTVSSRSLNFHFSLQRNAVPCVSSYTYLGVTFQTSRKWKLRVE